MVAYCLLLFLGEGMLTAVSMVDWCQNEDMTEYSSKKPALAQAILVGENDCSQIYLEWCSVYWIQHFGIATLLKQQRQTESNRRSSSGLLAAWNQCSHQIIPKQQDWVLKGSQQKRWIWLTTNGPLHGWFCPGAAASSEKESDLSLFSVCSSKTLVEFMFEEGILH